MATPEVLQREQDLFLSSALLDSQKGEDTKSRGMSIEKKIEFLEGLTGKVSNRRSRRWLNDRLLMELVPRLDAEEIRGLFAPPPWGDDVPPSPFSMTHSGEWDKFRNIDMDKEANIINALKRSPIKRKGHVDSDKIAVLNAWHRVDCRTREALRRSFLSELIEGYEELKFCWLQDCIRGFIKESGDGDVLVLKVQDSFHRLLLHGVCEKISCSRKNLIFTSFRPCLLQMNKYQTTLSTSQIVIGFYNLVSVTVTESKEADSVRMTTIKKKKRVLPELPNITLSHFLKMSKEGIW